MLFRFDGYAWTVSIPGNEEDLGRHGIAPDEATARTSVGDALRGAVLEGAPVDAFPAGSRRRDLPTDPPVPGPRDPDSFTDGPGGSLSGWVGVEDLNLGDYVRLTGVDDQGRQVDAPGFLLEQPEPVVVRTPGGDEPALAMYLGETVDSEPRLLYVSPLSLGVRAPEPEDDQGEGVVTAAVAEVREGNVPTRVAVDRNGRGAFPGSVVADPGTGELGTVKQARADQVVVRFDDDRERTYSAATIEVTDDGASRPAGWTAGGELIREGDYIQFDSPDGQVVGVASGLDGDDVAVDTPDGIVRINARDAQVVTPREEPAPPTPSAPAVAAADAAAQGRTVAEARARAAEALQPEQTGDGPTVDEERERVLAVVDDATQGSEQSTDAAVADLADRIRAERVQRDAAETDDVTSPTAMPRPVEDAALMVLPGLGDLADESRADEVIPEDDDRDTDLPDDAPLGQVELDVVVGDVIQQEFDAVVEQLTGHDFETARALRALHQGRALSQRQSYLLTRLGQASVLKDTDQKAREQRAVRVARALNGRRGVTRGFVGGVVSAIVALGKLLLRLILSTIRVLRRRHEENGTKPASTPSVVKGRAVRATQGVRYTPEWTRLMDLTRQAQQARSTAGRDGSAAVAARFVA